MKYGFIQKKVYTMSLKDVETPKLLEIEWTSRLATDVFQHIFKNVPNEERTLRLELVEKPKNYIYVHRYQTKEMKERLWNHGLFSNSLWAIKELRNQLIHRVRQNLPVMMMGFLNCDDTGVSGSAAIPLPPVISNTDGTGEDDCDTVANSEFLTRQHMLPGYAALEGRIKHFLSEECVSPQWMMHDPTQLQCYAACIYMGCVVGRENPVTWSHICYLFLPLFHFRQDSRPGNTRTTIVRQFKGVFHDKTQNLYHGVSPDTLLSSDTEKGHEPLLRLLIMKVILTMTFRNPTSLIAHKKWQAIQDKKNTEKKRKKKTPGKTTEDNTREETNRPEDDSKHVLLQKAIVESFPYPDALPEETTSKHKDQRRWVEDIILGKEGLENNSTWTQADINLFWKLVMRVRYERKHFRSDFRYSFASKAVSIGTEDTIVETTKESGQGGELDIYDYESSDDEDRAETEVSV